MENVLKIRRMRNLILEGKVTVFKSLALSKKMDFQHRLYQFRKLLLVHLKRFKNSYLEGSLSKN